MSLETLHRLSIVIPAALVLLLISAAVAYLFYRSSHRDNRIYYVYSKHMESSNARRRYK